MAVELRLLAHAGLAALPQWQGCVSGRPECGCKSCSPFARLQGSSVACEGCAQLAALPRELLLRVLHLAARPVSAWVG